MEIYKLAMEEKETISPKKPGRKSSTRQRNAEKTIFGYSVRTGKRARERAHVCVCEWVVFRVRKTCQGNQLECNGITVGPRAHTNWPLFDFQLNEEEKVCSLHALSTHARASLAIRHSENWRRAKMIIPFLCVFVGNRDERPNTLFIYLFICFHRRNSTSFSTAPCVRCSLSIFVWRAHAIAIAHLAVYGLCVYLLQLTDRPTTTHQFVH